MTRPSFAASLLSSAVIFSLLSGGLAGPACSAKYRKTSDCVQRCQSKWGVPGRMMGSDRWGSVMQKTENTKDAWDSIVSEACGMKSDKASSGPVKGVADPVTTSTSSTILPTSTSSTTSSTTPTASSSSSMVTSSSSSKPAASPTPPRPSTSTTSTPKPPSTTPKPPPAETPKQEPPKQEPPKPPAKALSGGGDRAEYLSAHNSVRAQHGASDLTWSDNLAGKAQQWANNCQFEHSGGSLGPFGENLAAGTSSSYSISDAVKSWTDEVSDYSPNNPDPSHFTQVVWKGSTELGCAIQSCDGIFDSKARFIVCEYSPQGNIIGQFDKNVQV